MTQNNDLKYSNHLLIIVNTFHLTAGQNDQTAASWSGRPHRRNRPGQIAHLVAGEEAAAVRQGAQRREDDLAEDKRGEGPGDEGGAREGNESDLAEPRVRWIERQGWLFVYLKGFKTNSTW